MEDLVSKPGVIRGAQLGGSRVVLGLHQPPRPASAVPAFAEAAPRARPDQAPPAASVPAETATAAPQVETMLALARPVDVPAPAPSRDEDAAERRHLREEARLLGRKEGQEEGHAEGREAGRLEGLREGREEAQRELKALREADERKLAQLLASISGALDNRLAAMEGDLADLAFAAVCRLLGSGQEPRYAQAAVAQVLGQVRNARRVRVRVAPAEYQRLSNEMDMAVLLPAGAEVTVEPDPAVRLGGCILATDAGEWDGRLETQLARLHEALRAAAAAGRGADA